MNKAKHLEWARQYLTESFEPAEVFSDVTWTESALCNLKVTGDSVAESGENHQRINPGRFMLQAQ